MPPVHVKKADGTTTTVSYQDLTTAEPIVMIDGSITQAYRGEWTIDGATYLSILRRDQAMPEGDAAEVSRLRTKISDAILAPHGLSVAAYAEAGGHLA